eukprot:tig00000403_g341.t1
MPSNGLRDARFRAGVALRRDLEMASPLRPAIELPSGLTLHFDSRAGWMAPLPPLDPAPPLELHSDSDVESSEASAPPRDPAAPSLPSPAHRPRAGTGGVEDAARRASQPGLEMNGASQPPPEPPPPPSFEQLLQQLQECRAREQLSAERRARELEARVAALAQAQAQSLRVDEKHLRALPAAELDELSERLVAALQLVTGLSKVARRKEALSPRAQAAPFECPVCLEALERGKRRVLQPCGHVLCEACGARVLALQPQRCPIARCEIYAMSPVYD